jgi:hypothetical protein
MKLGVILFAQLSIKLLYRLEVETEIGAKQGS